MLFYVKNVIINIKNRGGILDFIISFFRDFLSGPLYIIVVIVSVIGIFACIGYIAKVTIKQREEQKKYEQMYSGIHLLPSNEEAGVSMVSNVETAISSAQLDQVGSVSATNIAQTQATMETDDSDKIEVLNDSSQDSSS